MLSRRGGCFGSTGGTESPHCRHQFPTNMFSKKEEKTRHCLFTNNIVSKRAIKLQSFINLHVFKRQNDGIAGMGFQPTCFPEKEEEKDNFFSKQLDLQN